MAYPDAPGQSGKRANLELVRPLPAPPTALRTLGLSTPLATGFRKLLRTAGASISLEQGAGPAEHHGFQLDAGHNSRIANLVRTGVEIHPIQGLKGILGGQSPMLQTVVVGIPDDADASTRADALALLGRALTTPQTLLAVDQPRLDAAPHLLPEAAIESTAGARAMDRLLRAPGDVAAVIASPAQAVLFAAAGHAVAGTHQLDISLGVDDNTWTCCHRGAPEEEACGLTLACAWALFCTGDHITAARLHNALLCALEDGLHTPALKTVLPYDRTLDNREMLQAIGARLGASPRRLPAVDYAPAPNVRLQRVG